MAWATSEKVPLTWCRILDKTSKIKVICRSKSPTCKVSPVLLMEAVPLINNKAFFGNRTTTARLNILPYVVGSFCKGEGCCQSDRASPEKAQNSMDNNRLPTTWP